MTSTYLPKMCPMAAGRPVRSYREGNTLFPRYYPGSPHGAVAENALKRGYRGNAAFPFALGTKNAGILSLYAPVTGFFDTRIIEFWMNSPLIYRLPSGQSMIRVPGHGQTRPCGRARKRYRNVVEDQTEFISRFLPDGTHVFVNDAYCRYLGLDRDRILGHRSGQRYLPETRSV